MFDRIRKAFSRNPPDARHDADTLASAPVSVPEFAYAPVSVWAATQGFEFLAPGVRQAFAVTGEVGGKHWHLELGAPSRSYVIGEELRARADLGLATDIAVVVMNRQLKESLQVESDLRRATADASQPESERSEELTWLAQYAQVQWDGPADSLWSRFAVLAHRREDAAAWLEPELLRQLLAWPLAGDFDDVPFLLLLLRGKVLLRMEYRPADLPTLQHAAAIFTNACESALDHFSRRANCQEALSEPH